MSQVRRGTASIDDTQQTLVDYPSGGVFRVHVEAGGLGAQTLTLTAYTRAHQAAEEILAKTVTITGATPTDPSVLRLELVTTQPVRFDVVLDVAPAVDCKWWIESVGQVATIEDGETTVAADGSEQTVAASTYPGIYGLLVDVSAMQAGDDVDLRLKTYREGAYYVEEFVTLSDAQTDGLYLHGPIVAPEKCQATLRQTGGSNRSYPCSVVRLG